MFAIFLLVGIASLANFIETETGLLGDQNPETLLGSLPDGLKCSKFMICSSTRVNNAIKEVPAGERVLLWGGGLAYSGGSGPLPQELPSTVFSRHSCSGSGTSRSCLIRNLYYFGERRPQFGVSGGFAYLGEKRTTLNLGQILGCPSDEIASSIVVRQATVQQVHTMLRTVPKVRAFSHLHVLMRAGTSQAFFIKTTDDARLMLWERKPTPFGIRMACEARCTSGNYDASNGNCTVVGGDYIPGTYHCHATDEPAAALSSSLTAEALQAYSKMAPNYAPLFVRDLPGCTQTRILAFDKVVLQCGSQ